MCSAALPSALSARLFLVLDDASQWGTRQSSAPPRTLTNPPIHIRTYAHTGLLPPNTILLLLVALSANVLGGVPTLTFASEPAHNTAHNHHHHHHHHPPRGPPRRQDSVLSQHHYHYHAHPAHEHHVRGGFVAETVRAALTIPLPLLVAGIALFVRYALFLVFSFPSSARS